ncbi:MAG: portal protein [Pararhodobacter sp.]
MLQKIQHEKHPHAALAARRWAELKTERSPMEADWEEIARLIRPQRGGFSSDRLRDRQHKKPLSSAPIRAQSNFAAGLYGTLTNPANEWMRIKTGDDDLNRWPPMAEWNELVSMRVLRSFMPANSSFYDAVMPLFSDIAAFGNAAQYDEIDTARRKIRDVTISLSEVVCDIDAYGFVSEVVRRFHLKPAAAVEMFGADVLPPKIVELARKHSNDLHAYLHHVGSNRDYRRGSIGPRGKRWFSRYAMEAEGWLIRDRGYEEMPFYVPRWEVETGFTWGTGPGFTALASTRAHHQMDAATLRAAQRAADPTILAPDRNAWPLQGAVRPGHVVYGGVSMRGEPLMMPLATTGQIGLTLEEKAEKKREIEEAFYWSLMNLAGRTGLSPMEVAQIEAERTRLWAPNMGRIQHEFLAPKIERRFRLLWRAGQIPPPPETGQRDVPMLVEYTSAAAMAQKADQRMRIVQLLHDVTPLSQIDPRYMDRIEPDDVIETLHESLGAPARMLRTREEADKVAEQRQQAQQGAAMMQMAQQGAGAMKDAAGAMAALEGGGA